MEKVIILAGAGQLGSRHLQGLMKMSTPAHIYVVEPDKQAALTARFRAAEISEERAEEIQFVQNAGQLQVKNADLVVVATNADVRPVVVSEIVTQIDTGMLVIEKVAYQSVEIFEQQLRLLDNANVRAWVNCPRRLYPFYRELKTQNGVDGPVAVRISGTNWGIGCNTVHFIDLWSFLASANDLEPYITSLDPAVLASKRKGYSEFTGSMEFSGSAGSLLVESFSKWQAPVVIDIIMPSGRYLVSESTGMVISFQTSPGSKPQTSSVRFPFQSELTGMLADELLATGSCALPTLRESFVHHSILLPLLTEHYNHVTGSSLTYCPIT